MYTMINCIHVHQQQKNHKPYSDCSLQPMTSNFEIWTINSLYHSCGSRSISKELCAVSFYGHGIRGSFDRTDLRRRSVLGRKIWTPKDALGDQASEEMRPKSLSSGNVPRWIGTSCNLMFIIIFTLQTARNIGVCVCCISHVWINLREQFCPISFH